MTAKKLKVVAKRPADAVTAMTEDEKALLYYFRLLKPGHASHMLRIAQSKELHREFQPSLKLVAGGAS
jgi:hypothetical protein